MAAKKIARFLAILCLVGGAALLGVPKVEQRQYTLWAGETISRFEAGLATASLPEYSPWNSLYLAMDAYNQDLFQQGQQQLTDPFAYEQAAFPLAAYGLEDDMIGYLVIPALDLSLPVYLGASRDNLARGAAHLGQTSLPVGGGNTNAVIAAHRGMPSALMFRDLHRLEEGDMVVLTNFHETLSYRVAFTSVIQPHEVEEILIRPGEDLLTLLTCHPYGSNRQRYLVICRRETLPEEQ